MYCYQRFEGNFYHEEFLVVSFVVYSVMLCQLRMFSVDFPYISS
jgi:hypothetical protein